MEIYILWFLTADTRRWTQMIKRSKVDLSVTLGFSPVLIKSDRPPSPSQDREFETHLNPLNLKKSQSFISMKAEYDIMSPS